MTKEEIKQFERNFWRENDPITTPIWKCLEAFANQKEEDTELNLRNWIFKLQEEIEQLEIKLEKQEVEQVSDYSTDIRFWKRLKGFIADVQVNCGMGDEEKEMILSVCKAKLKK